MSKKEISPEETRPLIKTSDSAEGLNIIFKLKRKTFFQ